MLKLAEEYASEFGYKKVKIEVLDARNDDFWGNRFVAEMSKVPVRVTTCLYKPELTDEEKKERSPRIEIDMHFGDPRLSIEKPDKTFACVTYNISNKCESAQAFKENGILFALELKQRIDNLLPNI